MRNTILFVGVAVATLFASSAYALTLYPSTEPHCTTDFNSANNEASYINTCFGTSFTNDDLIYKQDQGGPESGDFAPFYSTAFDNTPDDPMDAVITWIGPQSISCASAGTCILAVKDGNQSPAYYFFDLYLFNWDGTETINLLNFWPDQGAISHVSIWGTSRSVPEPGTLGLLGLGLAGLGFGLRRRDKA